MSKLGLALGVLVFTTGALADVKMFSDRLDYPFLYTLGGIVVADFNGDGFVDVLTSDYLSASIMFGKGDGTFDAPQSIILGAGGILAAADLNGDGNIDLVSAGVSDGDGVVYVALGNGDGTFQAVTKYSLGSQSGVSPPVIADFNGDGTPDVAIRASSGVIVLPGKGGGKLGFPRLTPLESSGDCCGEMAVGAINGGRAPDLVLSTALGSFLTLLNDGTGKFSQFSTSTGFSDYVNFAVADVNSDGYADVLVSPQSGNYVELFLSTGNGTYQAGKKIAIPNAGVLAVGDLNWDGHPDLINSDAYVLYGDGKGDFGKPRYYPVASSPYYFGWAWQVFLTDTRNLGRLDVITANEFNGFSVLLNNGSGMFNDGVVTEVSDSPACGISADFNGDGKPDVALSTESGITMLFGTGNPAVPFDLGPVTPVASATCAVEGDLNNDRVPDLLIPVLAAAPATTATWYSYLGNGDGTFRQAGTSVNPDYGWMVLADFNQDGKLDYANASNFLALGNGDGTFQTPQPFVPFLEPDTLSFYSIVAGDLNGDGYPDLLLTDVTHQYLYVLLNNQQGGWNETVLHVPGNSCGMPEAEVIADVTGDGLPDAVLACIGGGGATIFTNQGGGELAYSATVGSYTGSGGTSVTAVDVNGDGIPDLEIYSDLTMAICLGEGSGKFAKPFFVGTGPDPARQIPINLSGSAARAGFSDFVIPDLTGRILTILNTAK